MPRGHPDAGANFGRKKPPRCVGFQSARQTGAAGGLAGAGSGSLLPEPGLLVSAWRYFTVQLNEAVPVTAFASLALTLTE